MTARSLIVVQPDGASERLTFLPSGVHTESVKTPKPKLDRSAPATPSLPPSEAFDPTSPGWATPPWPTSRVPESALTFSTRGDLLTLRMGSAECSFTVSVRPTPRSGLV